MRVTHDSGPGYHPNAGVKSGHPSPMSRMSRNETQTMLFGPEAFQVGMSGNGGVSLVVHVGEVGDDEKVGMAEER